MAAEGFYMNSFTTCMVFVVTFLLVYLNTRRPKWIPPGPPLLPVIGNLLCLAQKPLGSLAKLREKYGDVLGLYIGSELTVFVNGYAAIHEVLVKKGNLFSWRPETPFNRKIILNRAIVFEQDELWKKNRRFAQTTFQKLCFSEGSKGIEAKINDELSFFVDKLKTLEKASDISQDINLSLANVIGSILYEERPGYNDPKMLWYLDTLHRIFKSYSRNQVLTDCFPFLALLPLGTVHTLKGFDEHIRNHFVCYLLENHVNYVEGEETCFVHYMITHFKAADKTKWEDIVLNNCLCWAMLHDLMVAGSETSATTIKWILLALIRNPQIQTKAREEIDRVIGQETPSIHHRKHLPYLEATILEGLRVGHVVPLGVPHSTKEDVNFRGYRIPRNTTILLNIASVLKDPDIFPDPESFKPERFLSPDGQSVVVPDEFIPFSKGPRSCIGESMARIELFLYMATLLQRFSFHPVDPDALPPMDGVVGITYCPKPYKLNLVSR